MDKKKSKRKNGGKDNESTKDECAVAKYLKFNAPTKPGKFIGNDVQFFIGSKIVDFLLESKWSNKNPKAKNILFTTRASCVLFCQQLLEKGFFHRVSKPERREKKVKTKDIVPEESAASRRKSKKETSTNNQKDSEDCGKVEKTEETDDKKRKKKKQKLEMHDLQLFRDGPDMYVWIYDPVSMKTFIIGLLLVVGSIGVCLFPLWPPEVKVGIYYLSLAAAGFIGVILVLCILRMILFVVVWLSTVGKVSFWMLPNLTEDVGFFESFVPLYKVEYWQPEGKGKEKALSKKGDADKKSSSAEENAPAADSTPSLPDVRNADQRKDIADDRRIEEEDDDDEEEEEEKDEEKDDGHVSNESSNGYELLDVEDDCHSNEDEDGDRGNEEDFNAGDDDDDDDDNEDAVGKKYK